MKRIRRRVRHEAIGVSMFDRWIGASTKAPVAGMCWRPSMPVRVHSRVNPATNALTTEYRARLAGPCPARNVSTLVTAAPNSIQSSTCVHPSAWCRPGRQHVLERQQILG